MIMPLHRAQPKFGYVGTMDVKGHKFIVGHLVKMGIGIDGR